MVSACFALAEAEVVNSLCQLPDNFLIFNFFWFLFTCKSSFHLQFKKKEEKHMVGEK